MDMKAKLPQPWIYSPQVDLSFIILPAFLVTALVVVLQYYLPQFESMPAWLWLVLIVGVDVTHVYSTLFRTYLDKNELQQRQAMYLLTPLLAWVAGCFLYSLDGMIFWRALAYLAVFHFVRQQYGFMMLYGRKDDARFKMIDKLAIYSSTLYPLIYWHCHERNFDWFIAGDFFKIDSPVIGNYAGTAYAIVLTTYLIKELLIWRQSQHFNWPRNLILLGSALSWFVGIILFNNDLAFSAINIISHGIPYIALIWIYGRNQTEFQGHKTTYQFAWVAKAFRPGWIMFYLGVLFLWAYFEETLWDGLVWREHGAVLMFADALPAIQSEQTLIWLVPLLAMPQITHYVLDAFIWQMKPGRSPWNKILFLHAK
jgi:hypothetical protein